MDYAVRYVSLILYIAVSHYMVTCKVAPKPVASWAFTATNGGTDLKGDNHFDLTNMGYGEGPYGESDGAVILPTGTTQSMVVPNPTDALRFTTGMTYFTHVFLTGTTRGPLFEYNSATSPDTTGMVGALLWVWPNVTDIQAENTGSNDDIDHYSAKGVIQKNAWHKIAVVWSPSQLRFYVNGYLVRLVNFVIDLSQTLTGHIHVGRRPGLFDSQYYLSGRMACAQFYDESLSDVEIRYLTCQQYDISTFMEQPAFLFIKNEELCRLDSSDTTDLSTSDPVCIYSGLKSFLRADIRRNNVYMLFNHPTTGIIAVEQHLDSESIYTALDIKFRGISGMYYDYMGGNLFWSDHITNNIGLYNRHTKSYIPVVTNLPYPLTVVVDIPTGRVLWADKSPSISWAIIGSTDKNYFITSGISATDVLAIDITDRRLYWNNDDDDTISSADITTNTPADRRVVVTNVDQFTYGIAVSEDYIFWTDKSGAHVAQKQNGERVRDFLYAGTAHQVVYNGLYSQPLEYNKCTINNGGCVHICVPAPSSGHKCLCKAGYHIEDSGQSCKADYLSDDFILYTDGIHKTLYQADIITGDTHAVEFPITLEYPSAVEYNSQDGTVFFTDKYTTNLYKYQIEDPSSIEIIHQFSETAFLNGIAYDNVTEKLYITDSGDKNIYRIDTQGVHLEYFVSNAGTPRDIVLDTNSRSVYWTDWTSTYAKIVRADMADAASRKTIIIGLMQKPNGITIDVNENRLYWVDGGYGRIETSDLNGNSRRTLVSNLEGYMFDIFCERTYLYATDFYLGYIYEIEKYTGSVNAKHKIHGEPVRIAVHSTPKATTISTTTTTTTPTTTSTVKLIGSSTTSLDALSTKTTTHVTSTYTPNNPQQLGDTNEDKSALDPLLMYIIIGVGGFIVLVIVITVGAVCCYKRRLHTPQPAVAASPPPYTAGNQAAGIQMSDIEIMSNPSNAPTSDPSLRYTEHPVVSDPIYTKLVPGTRQPPIASPTHRAPMRLPTVDNQTYMSGPSGNNPAIMPRELTIDSTYVSMYAQTPGAGTAANTESQFFNELTPARVENPEINSQIN